MGEELAKFVDHLWGSTGLEDDGPYPGFVALEKRITEGKNTLKMFEDILLKRAEMEKAYGYAMIKMAEGAAKKETDSTGEMKQAWESLVMGLKKTGLAHVELGKQMTHGLSPKFKEFKNSHSTQRKDVMKHLSALHAVRVKAYAILDKSKAHYYAKCKELAAAEKAAASPGDDPKAAEKAKSAHFKAQQSKEKALYQYKQAVANAEVIREQFEAKFQEACSTVEGLERRRLDELRRQFWVYANMGSVAAVVDDNANEETRAALEKVESDQEIRAFLASAGTGSVRPVPLSFVEYGEEDPRPELSKAAAAAAVTIGGLGLAGSAVAGAGANGNDALDVADESVLVADGPGAPRLNSAVGAGLGAATSTGTANETDVVTADEASIDSDEEHDTNTYTVVIPYAPQAEPELELNPGDVVEIESRDEDPWWFGRIGDREGVVYKAYLEPLRR